MVKDKEFESWRNQPHQLVLTEPVKPPTETIVITPTTSAANSKEPNLGEMNKESKLILSKNETTDKIKEEADLEEIYFPSPPKITFEDYDTAIPEPNLIMLGQEDKVNSDPESEDYPKFVNPEPDVVFSVAEDLDNESVEAFYKLYSKEEKPSLWEYEDCSKFFSKPTERVKQENRMHSIDEVEAFYKPYSDLVYLNKYIRSLKEEKPSSWKYDDCSKFFNNLTERVKQENRMHSNEH